MPTTPPLYGSPVTASATPAPPRPPHEEREPRMSSKSRLLLIAAAALALAAIALPAAASAKTHWLCKPGLAHDPCTPGLSTTVYSATGAKVKVEHPKADKKPAADCFYVYPTVSDQKTPLANFKVDDTLRSIALYQTARYSQHCRVFAPTYRQVTLTQLTKTGTETAADLARGIKDVRAAFQDYLKHDNHGRPFVLIGHSQGAFVLRKLVPRMWTPSRRCASGCSRRSSSVATCW